VQHSEVLLGGEALNEFCATNSASPSLKDAEARAVASTLFEDEARRTLLDELGLQGSLAAVGPTGPRQDGNVAEGKVSEDRAVVGIKGVHFGSGA
jgi:hypothetical protein